MMYVDEGYQPTFSFSGVLHTLEAKKPRKPGVWGFDQFGLDVGHSFRPENERNATLFPFMQNL